MKELFHVAYWLVRTYARGAKPSPGLAFNSDALPKTTPLPKQTIEKLQRLEAQLRDRDEKLSVLLADNTALDAELVRLRAEIAAAKKANTAQADTHNYSEAETRDYFIDLLLKEAGGRSIRNGIGNSPWKACPVARASRPCENLGRMPKPRAKASWITCCGETTDFRWRWWRITAKPKRGRNWGRIPLRNWCTKWRVCLRSRNRRTRKRNGSICSC